MRIRGLRFLEEEEEEVATEPLCSITDDESHVATASIQNLTRSKIRYTSSIQNLRERPMHTCNVICHDAVDQQRQDERSVIGRRTQDMTKDLRHVLSLFLLEVKARDAISK